MLSAKNSEDLLNEKMGAMEDYLKANGVNTVNNDNKLATRVGKLIELQGENYLTSMDIQRAIAANDIADKRFYFSKVREATKFEKMKPGDKDYEKLEEEYQNRILHAAGGDVFSNDITVRNNALMSVKASAYEMFEKERQAISSKYATYLDTQVTLDVKKDYDTFLSTKNIDGIVAVHSVLGPRGDHDYIRQKLLEMMKDENYLQLGEDFTSRLALSLIGMTKQDPFLGRLGKHLNKETWDYTNTKDLLEKGVTHNSKGEPLELRPQGVTAAEYVAGVLSNGKKLKKNGLRRLMLGTSFKEIERNALDNIIKAIEYVQQEYPNLHNPEDPTMAFDFKDLQEQVIENIMPQIVTALPTYESGGEQIRNMLEFLTGGAKFNEDTKQWTGTTSDLGQKMTIKYLGALTPNDVINFKSDAFNAVKYTLIQKNGGREDLARAEFKKVISDSGALAKLKNSDPGYLNPMKKPVKEWLDLL
jgi:hypothetical protein